VLDPATIHSQPTLQPSYDRDSDSKLNPRHIRKEPQIRTSTMKGGSCAATDQAERNSMKRLVQILVTEYPGRSRRVR
jgi:hypothetical protein